MPKFKYILNNCSGDVWTKSGKTTLSKDLSQRELENLYNEGMTNIVSRFEIPEEVKTKTEPKVKKEK